MLETLQLAYSNFSYIAALGILFMYVLIDALYAVHGVYSIWGAHHKLLIR
jgi:hypothetical protein